MSKEENPIEAKALAAVEAERLTTLLAEVAMTNPGVRRRLQFELSAQRGEDVAASVDQWISEFGEQTSVLGASTDRPAETAHSKMAGSAISANLLALRRPLD